MTMSKILKHFLLIAVSLFSLVVITINENSVSELYWERSDFQNAYYIYEDYTLAIRKNANLKHEFYDSSKFASYVNSDDNLPCATIAGYHFRLEEIQNPKKWDKYDEIPEWNFFINVYETNLPIESCDSYFDGITKGVIASLGDSQSVLRSEYENYPTLRHYDVVDDEPANTIVVFTNNLAYHITAIDSSEFDEVYTLLKNLSFNIPTVIDSIPWIAIVFIILLQLSILVEVILCIRNLKGLGYDNKVARGFVLFAFVMLCAYFIASIVYSVIAIIDVWEYCQEEYIICIWVFSGLVFFLSAFFNKLLSESHLHTGVAFILPQRWKVRLKDNKISRTIVIFICYPCLISLAAVGFLAIPFVLFVYILFRIMYVIKSAVKWVVSGSMQ